MNYVEEVEKVRLEIMKRIEEDSDFIQKLSEGSGVGIPSIWALIYQWRATQHASVKKINDYLKKDK